MEKPTGWGVPALIVMPISVPAVMHLAYSGLDQRTLHAHGREIRATVADTYWVDQGRTPRSSSRLSTIRRDGRYPAGSTAKR